MSAWEDYLAAAQRLDAVRQGAATAAGEQAEAVQDAREELTAVRARLVPQQARLRALGVPEPELVPAPAEVAAAGQAMAAGPAAVLAGLRQARGTADVADVMVTATRLPSAALGGTSHRRRTWVHALVVYGPFALAVLVLLSCLGIGAFALFG
ncbi:hypothetical protein ACI2K4_15160 [Micromonospora sp. NPDC050397]|uniref:hypothetical protein n=1 Tax=Micromonospora sp. NPDC050397 TaxID=3364279 RepID=UPI003850B5D7